MKPSKEELIQQGVPEDMVETAVNYPNQNKDNHIVLEGYLTEDEPPVRLWRYLEEGDDDYQDYLWPNRLFSSSKFIKVEYETT